MNRRIVRIVVGYVAGVAAIVVGVVWILGFLYISPLALRWHPIVLVSIVPIVPGFAFAVGDLALTERPWTKRPMRLEDLLTSRARRYIATAVFFAVFLAFFLAFFQGAIGPEVIDGRYYSNDHGDLTEITRRQWLHLHTLESRIASGHLMAFGTIAALYLTQPAKRPVVVVESARPAPTGRHHANRPSSS